MRGAERKVLVIGGGIGGLTAALALRRSGWEVEVFEQAPRLREVGSGLMLSPNAMRVLFGLGLRHVAERGAEMTHFEMCSWRGTPLVRGSSAELGFCADAPPTLFHRAALHGALHEALGNEGVHLGARLARFEDDGRTVRAWFEDGREARGDVLVGADGLRSVVRARLHPGEPLRYAGYPCWRGLVRSFEHPALPRGILRETQGAGVRFAAGYVREDLVYWWATVNWPQEKPVPGGDKAFLLETFRTAHAPISELIAATDEADVLRNDLHDRLSLERWGEGRVSLLGDAAHPMMPNLGQGACSAIEDAVVLAAALEETEDIASGLRRYEARRQSRTSWLQRGSWMFGVVGQWQNPLAVWLREQSIRLTPMRVMMKQYEQLWNWRLEAGR
ncbi:FAD-dependent monooxygenase [Archangium lipolyticum]|uniref:FAD-dependent monooxygenase n=1 Tax=Archangium lipolyticum TaxID=2970465 RepID=UPI00214A07F6|nr:FAD-dependent monooxygenase [Archangium lipolyticum]